MNGIFQLKLKGTIQLYADDIALVYGENSSSNLKTAMESDLDSIECLLNADFGELISYHQPEKN